MITEEQVKKVVNRLIDLKSNSTVDFNDQEMRMRAHGITLSIDIINGVLFGDPFRPTDEKYELETDLITA